MFHTIPQVKNLILSYIKRFVLFYNSIFAIFKREMKAYFYSTTAFIYVTLFLFTVNGLTFYIGNLIALGQATLVPFFMFHIYVYLLFLPALSMKLWSEERKTGTMDLLLTMPISVYALVIGKFLASWAFVGIALLGTIPIWISINILGNPDNNIIIFSYLSSFLIAGAFLSMCSYVSIQTNKQIIAFILSIALCFGFLITGSPLISEFFSHILPINLGDIISNFSILTHYENFIKGYFQLSALLYIFIMIVFFIYLTKLRIDDLRLKGL